MQGRLTPETVFRFIQDHPVSAPVIFLAFYNLSITLMFPTLPLNLAAGVLWGPFWGSLLAFLGCVGGAIASFVISRTSLGQPLAGHFHNQYVLWLQTELEEKGWRVVAFTRLNPVIPSGPLNYIFGLTSISFTTYTWATMVFIYPLALAFAAIGHYSGQFLLLGKTAQLVNAIILVSAGVTVLSLVRFFMKRWYLKDTAPGTSPFNKQRIIFNESNTPGNGPK